MSRIYHSTDSSSFIYFLFLVTLDILYRQGISLAEVLLEDMASMSFQTKNDGSDDDHFRPFISSRNAYIVSMRLTTHQALSTAFRRCKTSSARSQTSFCTPLEG